METPSPLKELELKIKSDLSRAVIEGMTTVPFQSLVKLILQRKVDGMFKDWGKDPVIVTSELLTSLASAPQDSRENNNKVVIVALGAGVILGVFLFALVQLVLDSASIIITRENLFWLCGGIVAIGIVGYLVARLQKAKQANKVVETMEKITGMFS